MAKLEAHLNGGFDSILNTIHRKIISDSSSASYEDGSDYSIKGFRCAVRVYERYSVIGSNRVSMSIMLVEGSDDCFISAITSGGSQAVFFKVNTFGEEAFLDCLCDAIQQFR